MSPERETAGQRPSSRGHERPARVPYGSLSARRLRRAEQAPGVVKVRILGRPADVATLTALLAGHDGRGIEVIRQSAPYAGRRDAGERVYLTLRLTSTDKPGAGEWQ